MSVFLLVAVIAGFWPQYFGPLVTGVPLDPLLTHWGFALHSTASLGWMVVFAVQSILVWRGKARVHRRLGPFLVAYGVLVILVDLYAGLGIELRRIELGEELERAGAFLFLIARDVAMFGAFMAAAVVYRKQPELHKRLMFLATLSFATVGTGRLVGRWLLPDHFALFVLVCLSPILLAMAYDGLKQRRVHPVYVIGLVLFALRLRYANFNLGLSDFWRPIGQAVLKPFLG